MTLSEMVSWVFSALGDPGESEAAIFGEVVRCLNAGQTRVSNMMPNKEREKFATTNTQAAVVGQAAYTMPADLLDIIRVDYDTYPINRLPIRSLSALKRNTQYRGNKQRQQFFYEIGTTAGRTKIVLSPVPNTTGNIDVYYFRKPVDFHDQGTYKGTVTLANSHTGGGAPTTASSVSTTVFHDAVATFAADRGATPTDTANDTSTTPTFYGQTGFWNDGLVRFTSGNNAGASRRVTTFKDYVAANANVDGLNPQNAGTTKLASYGRFVFATADAWLNTPAIGDTFELDQVSVLPDQMHDLVCLWACFLMAPKVQGKDPQFFKDAFMDSALQMGLKHTQNVEAVTVGETPGGAR